jgi:hypothetical protein
MSTPQMVALLAPLILIDLGLAAVAVVDWSKRKRFKLLPRLAWLAVIVLVNTIGPLLYFTLGRADQAADGEEEDR